MYEYIEKINMYIYEILKNISESFVACRETFGGGPPL